MVDKQRGIVNDKANRSQGWTMQLTEVIHADKKIGTKSCVLGSSQTTHNVLGTSPKDPLKVLTFGTYRGPSANFQGANTKINELMIKFILELIVLVLHVYSCFSQEEKILKSSKWGRSQDVFETQLQTSHRPNEVTFLERLQDVSQICFLNSIHKHI